MINLFKHSPTDEDTANQFVHELFDNLCGGYPFTLDQFSAGKKILAASPEIKRLSVREMVKILSEPSPRRDWDRIWHLRDILFDLLKQKIPFTEEDILFLFQHISHLDGSLSQIIKIVSNHSKNTPLSPELRQVIETLTRDLDQILTTIETRRLVARLKELLGETDTRIPLDKIDDWAVQALNEISALPSEKQNAWAQLLQQCLRAGSSTPSEKWLKTNDSLVERIGRDEFFAALLRWFPLAGQIRSAENAFLYGSMAAAANIEVLRGLVWQTVRCGTPEMLRAITTLAVNAYRKVPGRGPHCPKVGNACFWTLGNLPGRAGIAQLSLLKMRIKGNATQKIINNTIDAAAKRAGLTAGEIEELSVPAYGLDEVGRGRVVFGDAECEIQVNGVEVETIWRKGGKKVSAAPKAVKDQHPEELKDLTQALKDLRKMLPVQRDRLENMYLTQKKWRFGDWQEHYLNHPLMGTIARRLIWKFSQDDRAASGIWLDGRLVGRDDAPLDWLSAETSVELWHPLHVDTQVVLEWRAWLFNHMVRQPFKQAHREIYILTDAERHTHTYSNRFAAHILRQHQYSALCAARGWKNTLQLLVDSDAPATSKLLPAYGLRAEYWVQGAGSNYGTDTNETGTYLYVSTDQVRFHRMDASENRSHMGGGAFYTSGPGDPEAWEPIPLEQIPPLVFSEIFRDVDMFVGVASVGNDPNWLDGGHGNAVYNAYWRDVSFGALSESAKTRKQVLEFLLPRLKIAERCRLTDKFLVVRGDLRTYKIHLGSSNILMEPNDQYLCIVPGRSPAEGGDKLFLPFEGDSTMALVLSKAFLLADDRKITDQTIRRQIE